MKLFINKSGLDINGNPYTGLYVHLKVKHETKHKILKVYTICYNGADLSDGGIQIIPEDWDHKKLIKLDFDGVESEIEDLVLEKVVLNFSSTNNVLYTPAFYEVDVFELDPMSGKKIKEKKEKKEKNNPDAPDTYKIKYKKGSPVKKANGTNIYHNLKEKPFCELDDIQIL